MGVKKKMDISNYATAAEIPIIMVIVGAITQLLKQKSPLPAWSTPWLAIILGTLAGLVAAKVTGDTNYISSGLAGAMSGGATCGLFDGVKGVTTTITDKAQATKQLESQNESLQSQINALKATVATSQSTITTLTAKLATANTVGTTGLTPKEGVTGASTSK